MGGCKAPSTNIRTSSPFKVRLHARLAKGKRKMDERYSTEGDYGLRTVSEPQGAIVEYVLSAFLFELFTDPDAS